MKRCSRSEFDRAQLIEFEASELKLLLAPLSTGSANFQKNIRKFIGPRSRLRRFPATVYLIPTWLYGAKSGEGFSI